MSKKKEKKLPLIQDDPWLEPYEYHVRERIATYEEVKKQLAKHYGSIKKMALAHKYLGFNYDTKKKGWYYREWAPMANALYLIGDFNLWNRSSHPLHKLSNGVWEIFLDDDTYKDSFVHGSLVKVMVVSRIGNMDRIPAYMTRVVQSPETHEFTGQLWFPQEPFEWTDQAFDAAKIEVPIIYEAHTGMATEKENVGTYREFADQILPRIKKLGYNTLQLMAVQEHPYYGSFGYHVSNFFAPSSRFGTPEDLKYLINKCHEMGVAIIMDIVHSHAVKNHLEGLNEFDGTDYQYFHGGGKGNHPAWDSKIFNYGKWEVMQFLLSNVRYWLEEFHFDGFRFDGVTSMMYAHHGHTAFDHYDKFFVHDVEKEAVTYLQLANELIHEIKPGAISVAEDVSGMPGLTRKIQDGGIGFDYRLGMGLPDFWIRYLKHIRDEDWNVWELWNVMVNRRYNEKTVAYAESHDQSLVGDKTVAFWLMDKEMYWHMQEEDDHIVIERGIALHKMIRLFTAALGGEGYLNFMGNEFGHPEWVDFPREGNNWSYHYARRQWSLVDNPKLKYKWLNLFDQEMIHLLDQYQVMSPKADTQQLNMDQHNHVIIFRRGKLIFLFNFHPEHSIPDYAFYVPEKGKYQLLLNSDSKKFGGHGRIDESLTYTTDSEQKLKVYLTNRTVLVLKKGK